MARELGLNPRKLGKLGKLGNHGQEPWKQPLPQLIERLYGKRFGRERPEVVTPIDEQARQLAQAKAGRKARRAVGAQTTETRDHERVPVLRVPGKTARWMNGSAPGFVRCQREHGSPRRVSLTNTTGVTSAETPPC